MKCANVFNISLADVTTTTMLIIGIAGIIIFIAVLLIEGVLRSGYNPIYHTGSELSLGRRGWVQVSNFLQAGLAMQAFALGVYRSLNTLAGAILFAAFGLGLISAGIFRADAVRGYPPGVPNEPNTKPSLYGQIHNASGPFTFFALFAACLTLVQQLHGIWRVYTIITAIFGLALTLGTAYLWSKDSKYTGLVQRALIIVYFIWIVLLGLHLI